MTVKIKKSTKIPPSNAPSEIGFFDHRSNVYSPALIFSKENGNMPYRSKYSTTPQDHTSHP